MYDRYQFLGASLRGFNSSISWNSGQPSNLTVQLVEDSLNGDVFNPPDVGTPVLFEFYSFRFAGLLQRWQKVNSIDGLPTYESTVVDPREILEGTQVVLSSYSGSVSAVANVINVFGYWENQGFGLSYSNEAGIPWFRVKAALAALINNPNSSAFGGPLSYRGYRYSLDLSELPQPPAYYRIGPATSIGLMELISQLCDDGAHDFFVELVGSTIKVRTVNKRNAPPLGTITTVVNSNSGNVIRSSSGVEARNEPTSTFLVGGEVTTLEITSNLRSFWGYDIAGAPIFGTPTTLHLTDERFTCILAGNLGTNTSFASFHTWNRPDKTRWPKLPGYLKIDNEVIKLTQLNNGSYSIVRGQYGTVAAPHTQNSKCTLVWHAVDSEVMNLNASEVADLIGDVVYPCSTLEMRLAKVNWESWAIWMTNYKKQIADRVGIISPFKSGGNVRAVLNNNVIAADRRNALLQAQAAIATDRWARQMQMYEFVKNYADEYMGRRYAVSLPNILASVDPETLRTRQGYEVTEGGYLPEGSEPLGLSSFNEEVFKIPDGRFRAFCRFDNLTDVDFRQTSPAGRVIENGKMFLEAAVDARIQLPGPFAVMTIQAPLMERPVDPLGGVEILAAVLQMSPAQAQTVLKSPQFGTIGAKVFPAHKDPASVAVPLKSNTQLYGPWYRAGSPGKVRFEQDPNLVPWNYGGFAVMTLAALARITESTSSSQMNESGSLELAGPPTASLGDTLESGGPNITNLSVSFGGNGVSTVYSFQTYTPKFGVFSRGNIERLRRLSASTADTKRALRAAFRESAQAITAVGNAARAAAVFMEKAPKAVKRQSPHEVLISYSLVDSETGSDEMGVELAGDNRTRVGVSASTLEEAVAWAGADDDSRFQASAVMSFSGLFRPFCTQPGGGVAMSSYSSPESGFDVALSKSNLDPWQSLNDVEVWTFGSSYSDLDARREEGDTANARVFALRGPLIINGWGRDMEGNPVPDNGSGGYLSDHLNRSQYWKTGPVDLLWDARRGVWSCHDVVKGVAATAVSPSGLAAGTLTVCKQNGSTSWSLPIYNWGPTPIEAGARVQALFDFLDGKWYAVSADYSPSGIRPGSGIQPVGWSNSAGSGSSYAREDHIHAHSIFASGDFHPEYNLAVGESDLTPIMTGVKTLLFDQSYAAEVVLTPQTATVRIREMAPSGPGTRRGLVPTPSTTAGTSKFLREDATWATPSFSYLSPSGDPYTVLHRGADNNPVWSGTPTILGITLGGSGIGDGYLALGPADDYRTTLRASTRSNHLALRLPDNDPEVGHGILVKSFSQSGSHVSGVLEFKAVPPTGLTASWEYVGSVTCSGSTLTVKYGQVWYEKGVLVAHSGVS